MQLLRRRPAEDSGPYLRALETFFNYFGGWTAYVLPPLAGCGRMMRSRYRTQGGGEGRRYGEEARLMASFSPCWVGEPALKSVVLRTLEGERAEVCSVRPPLVVERINFAPILATFQWICRTLGLLLAAGDIRPFVTDPFRLPLQRPKPARWRWTNLVSQRTLIL